MITDRSLALAVRLGKEADSLSAQIIRGFELALGRHPDSSEQQRLEKYVMEMKAYHEKITPEPTVYPTQITRSLVEELSGKPFEYQEILPVFENYTPDVKPHEATATTRALADFCLLLMNSNEFMYVY